LLGIAIFNHWEEGKVPDYSLALKEIMKAEIIYWESEYHIGIGLSLFTEVLIF